MPTRLPPERCLDQAVRLMKLQSISAQNFRCFGTPKTVVNLESVVTAFVGANGAGKTALLHALSRLFGITAGQRTIRRGDFHLGPDETGLTSGKHLSLEAVFSFPELDGSTTDSATDSVPEFFLQMVASGPGMPLNARMILRATWIEDGTPDGTIEEDIRWITTLGEDYVWEDCPKVQPVERGSIQLIYLPATRDASTPVTSLLKGRLWQAAKWSDKFKKTATKSTELIQKRFEREAPAEFVMERLASRWKQVYEGDTDTTPVLRLVESQFEEFVRTAKIAFHPDEAGQERDLADLSDGQRSLFHISLTAATLEVERDTFALPPTDSSFEHEKVRRAHLTILAIEEPENSLSPFFLSRILGQSREIGELASAQVILTSHSAAILGRIDPTEVRYFRLERKNREAYVTRIHLPVDDLEASTYVRLAVRAYPELYFARFVILGEGESERLVIPEVAHAVGIDLDPSFVPIVPLGGRYIRHFWRLLNDLKIPHVTLLDLDLGRIHGGATLLRSVIQSLKEFGNDLNKNPCVEFGLIDPADIDALDDPSLLNEDNIWLQALRFEGIFFSHPIDIDFSMLTAFPLAYQRPHLGGHGPHGDGDNIAAKKRVTLKTGGNPSLFDKSYDDIFKWYPYLFLSRSKPETHLAALGRIKKDDLVTHAPTVIKDLVHHVKKSLGLTDACSA